MKYKNIIIFTILFVSVFSLVFSCTQSGDTISVSWGKIYVANWIDGSVTGTVSVGTKPAYLDILY